MTDEQRAKLDSHLTVRTVCNQATHRALWSSLPAYVLLYDRFLAKIALVNAAILIQGADRTGLTEAKTDARRKLVDTALETAGLLSTYAYLTGHSDLHAQTDIVLSDLARLPDSEVDDRAQSFLDLARDLPSTPVGDTQITPASVGLSDGFLDLLETRIETYNLLLGTPRAARGEKSAATTNLKAALAAIDEILEKGLDKLMLRFRGTDFYLEYESARKIIDPGSPLPEPPPPSQPPSA